MITISLGSYRGLNRAAWRVLWRQMRIINRETMKANVDLMAFGTGVIETGPDIPNFVRHIDLREVLQMP